MKIGVIRQDQDMGALLVVSAPLRPKLRMVNGCWRWTSSTIYRAKPRKKLALGKLNHLGRMLKKWNVANKRVGKGSLYYLKKLSNTEKV